MVTLSVDLETLAASQQRIKHPLGRHLLQMMAADGWFLVSICLRERCGREESVEAIAFWGLQFDDEGVLAPTPWVSQGNYLGPADDMPTKHYEERIEYRPGARPSVQDCLYDDVQAPERGQPADA